MQDYRFLVPEPTREKLRDYLYQLHNGATAGAHLARRLADLHSGQLDEQTLLAALLNTKLPCIFAESAVRGDGSDWTMAELAILGDISCAVPVTVYDDGRHTHPAVHAEPFPATLLFVPGALLRNTQGQTPADWDEVTRAGQLDEERYYGLYQRRLKPLFDHAQANAAANGKDAFITVPGIGCGQFAGPFRGQLGEQFQRVLVRLLERRGEAWPNIRVVYYDPYNECSNQRRQIHGITLLTRPLLQGNQAKPQLCPPAHYAETGDDLTDCQLFSLVAWDHVSWPGNDYWGGARATDDGVKAAATDLMTRITGIEGRYDVRAHKYLPRAHTVNWENLPGNRHELVSAVG